MMTLPILLLSSVDTLKEKIALSPFLTEYPAEEIKELRILSRNTELETEIDHFISKHDSIFTGIFSKALFSEIIDFKSEKNIEHAVSVLLKINTESSLQVIIDAVQKSNPPATTTIINLLVTADQAQVQVVYIINELLTGLKSAFRLDIIQSIMKSNLGVRSELLINALNSKSIFERRLIKKFFFSLPPDPWIANLITKKLTVFNEKVIDDILDILIYNDPKRAKKRFKTLFYSENHNQRLAALMGFTKIKCSESKHILREALKQDKKTARITIRLLPLVFGNESSKLLLPLLSTRDYDTQVEVLKALKMVNNKEDFDSLISFLKSPHPSVRIHAIKALREIDERKLLPLLDDLVKDPCSDRFVRWEIIETLEKCNKASMPLNLLLSFLKDPDSSLRAKTIQVIAEMDVKSHLGTIKTSLEDPSYTVKSEVLSSLALIDDEEAMTSIETMVDGKDKDLRRQALVILLRKGLRETIAKRLPLIESAARERDFAREIARSKISDTFFLHLVELSHYCGVNLKFDYQAGIFRGFYVGGSSSSNININMFTVDPVNNKLEMEELMDFDNAVGRLTYTFDFDSFADNIKSKLTVKEFKLEQNSAVCKIYVPASVKASTIEMARHTRNEDSESHHIALTRSLHQFHPYERVRLLIEEFGSNGHAAAAIKGKVFIKASESSMKMAKMLFPLALDCLAWYSYHFFLTGKVPDEPELDSFRKLLAAFNQLYDKLDFKPLAAKTVQVIQKKYLFSDIELEKNTLAFFEEEIEAIREADREKEQYF
ncbi:MAG: HEAT repeat domain-containing protein [Candidatus Odinarchaeota archaeon]